jgi:hypothetical protein
LENIGIFGVGSFLIFQWETQSTVFRKSNFENHWSCRCFVFFRAHSHFGAVNLSFLSGQLLSNSGFESYFRRASKTGSADWHSGVVDAAKDSLRNSPERKRFSTMTSAIDSNLPARNAIPPSALASASTCWRVPVEVGLTPPTSPTFLDSILNVERLRAGSSSSTVERWAGWELVGACLPPAGWGWAQPTNQPQALKTIWLRSGWAHPAISTILDRGLWFASRQGVRSGAWRVQIDASWRTTSARRAGRLGKVAASLNRQLSPQKLKDSGFGTVPDLKLLNKLPAHYAASVGGF